LVFCKNHNLHYIAPEYHNIMGALSGFPTPPHISDEQLFAKYGKFCGYMAWQFVKRSGSYDAGERNVRLDTEDAEDLASIATYYLLRIPQQFRDQPPYIKRVIVSKIITAWHKRLKHGRNEWQPPGQTGDGHRSWGDPGDNSPDYFDTLPGRDGLAEHTQTSFDSAKVLALLPKLPEAQRIVLELYFGLNGAKPCGSARIATKLARTRYWVDARLHAGLQEIRTMISAKPVSHHVL
jgi:hypothetical protein